MEARTRSRQGPISHEELQQAIAKYLRDGGRIEKLPEQKSVSSSLVGRRWSSSAVEIDPQG